MERELNDVQKETNLYRFAEQLSLIISVSDKATHKVPVPTNKVRVCIRMHLPTYAHSNTYVYTCEHLRIHMQTRPPSLFLARARALSLCEQAHRKGSTKGRTTVGLITGLFCMCYKVSFVCFARALL